MGKILYRFRSFALRATCSAEPFRALINEAIEVIDSEPCSLVDSAQIQVGLVTVEHILCPQRHNDRTNGSCGHPRRPRCKRLYKFVNVVFTSLVGNGQEHLIAFLWIPIGDVESTDDAVLFKESQAR